MAKLSSREDVGFIVSGNWAGTVSGERSMWGM